MMLLDDMNDPFPQMVFTGQLDPILHVGGEDKAGHGGGEMVMPVFHPTGIFNEVKGFFQFPDVVVIGADSCQQRVGGNRFRACLHQASDNDAVMIRPGSLKDEVFQKGMVQISQFQQLDIGGIVEKIFDHRSQSQNQEGGQEAS